MSGLADYAMRLACDRVAGYIPPTFQLREAEGDEPAESTRKPYGWLIEQLSKFSPRTYFVNGVAGSGKTSLIAHVATDLLNNDVVCIRVDRQTLSLGRNALGDPKSFGRALCPVDVDESLWKSRVKHKKAVFLVDAVNELQREFSARSPEMDFIRRLLDGSHRYTVLATSRSTPEGLGGSHLRPIEQLTIAPLTDTESEGYLLDCGLDPRPALKEIRATGLDGAIWNPLLLSLLAKLLKSETPDRPTRMPRSRAELLLATVHRNRTNNYAVALEENIAQQGLGLEAVLCAAALVIFLSRSGEYRLQRKDLRAMLLRVWDDPASVEAAIDAFLNTQLVTVSGTGGGPGNFYQILHPSIVDFGLALGWRTSNPPGLALELDQFMGNWIGLQADPEASIQALLNRAPMMRASLMLDIIIANRGLLSPQGREQLWQALGAHFIGDRARRDDLALSLERVPFHVVQEGIGNGLLHPLQREQPEFALDVLESLQSETLTPLSLQQLKRRNIRQRKNQSAGNLPSPAPSAPPSRELVERRLQVLRFDPRSANRGKAAQWLARQAPAQSLPLLVDTLGTETNPAVRGAVATALGRLADAAALPALQAALADDAAEVRGSAATALGRLADASAVPALEAALDDEDPPVRGSAATALGRLADTSAVPALLAVLSDDDAAAVRGAAATALGRLADTSAVPALRTALSADEAASVRGAAATALGQLADAAAAPALRAALTGDDA
ncbi:HEAT repeat domain-containing protein, partial [Streptomyces sp. ISL-22]|uniref:HEAT repeat domain-containing protein n=2 Tax=unclassified Streptomyces TaxID=2593676 RepID=UPI001BE541AA